MKINNDEILEKKLSYVYISGFLLILALPLLAISPLFFPPEWGKAIAFRIIFSIIFSFFIWHIISSRKFFIKIIEACKAQKKILWILLGSLFALFLSTLLSTDILFSLWSSPHRSGGAVFFAFCVLFSILLSLIPDRNDWKKLWNFSFIIGDLAVGFAMLQYFNVFPDILVAYTGRPPSTLSNSILFAAYLMLLFFPVLYFAIKKIGKQKIFYLISLFLYSFGILTSGSRAAYLGIAIGGFYFLFFYPVIKRREAEEKNLFKKLPIFKIVTISFIILAIFGVYYVNTHEKLPQFLENNGVVKLVASRLSISTLLAEPRFSAWRVALNALKEKPVFGWGPENFSIGFDKYYDPNLPYITEEWGNWWDRAHNIFIDLALCNGLLFSIVYFLFFGILFYKLFKRRRENAEYTVSAHAILSTFLGYFITLLFGFDSVSTYIIFFFVVGYSLFLTRESATLQPLNQKEQAQIINYGRAQTEKNERTFYFLSKKKNVIAAIALIFFIWFLWQYNLKPLFINSEINKAKKLECEKQLNGLEKLFSQKSFLGAYLYLTYAENVKTCAQANPLKEIEYIKKGVAALKNASTIRPTYTRTWLMLGSFNTILLINETNPETQKNLYEEINNDFRKAQALGPNHQEIFSEWAKFYFAIEDYQKMKEKSEECIAIGENTDSCFWYLGLSEILLGDEKTGKKHIEIAKSKRFPYNTLAAYSQLGIVYTKTKNYKDLISVYESLRNLDPENIQYYASLAFLYKENGYYGEASVAAMNIFKLQPENKEAFDFILSLLYLSPNNPAIHSSLGSVYEQMGEKEKSRQEFFTAESIYLQLIENKDSDSGNHFKLAELYKNMKEYEKAIEQALISVDLEQDRNFVRQVKSFLESLPLPEEQTKLNLLRPDLFK